MRDVESNRLRRQQTASSPKTPTSVRSCAKTVLSPTLLDYRLYVERCGVRGLPVVHRESVLATLASVGDTRVTYGEVFTEEYLVALFETLSAGDTLSLRRTFSLTKISEAMILQLRSGARTDKWRNAYARDVGITSVNETPPMLLRVQAGRDASSGRRRPRTGIVARAPSSVTTTLERFREKHNVPLTTLDLGPLLHAAIKRKGTLLVGARNRVTLNRDVSLRSQDLKELQHKSLFHRRIYAAHALLWIVLCEGTYRASVRVRARTCN